MQKKILMPVDGSPPSQNALDYVGMMAGQVIKDLSVCLLFVMKAVPSFMRQEAKNDTAMHRRVTAMERSNLGEAKRVLESAKQRLLDSGMPEEAIETKATPRSSEITRNIIFEAEQGLYDAVALGRRNLSKAQELFTSSTTNRVVQQSQRVPVWAIGSQVRNQNILAPVDGSDGALRAVDHMAFMLGGNPLAKITLLHVGASLSNYCELDFSQEMAGEIEGHILESEQRCMDDFYGRAQKVLQEAGISPDQIETREEEGRLGVVRAIVEHANQGGFGTVVLGRRGEHKSFLLGHVADKVLTRLPGHAVWVVG